MIKNKNILITGGAGFIGSNLVNKLLYENNFVLVIDDFNDYYLGKEEQLNGIVANYNHKEDYNIIKGDLIKKSVLEKFDYEIDIIFHLAAQANVRHSLKHISKISKNNIISSINIFDYALNHNIQKTIFASSSSVYGNPIYVPTDEEHPKNPISPYAISKLCGELYANYYHLHYKLPICTLRFSTVYGPNGRPDMAIRKFFDLIYQDKEITIYGDGEQIRDFIYISDVIDGLILAAESNDSSGEIFNLGNSNQISINNLVDKMYKLTNRPKKVKYVNKQRGEVDKTFSNIEKAKKILDYSPKINIDQGLEYTNSWQKNLFHSR
ncbi:MAG: NAD-dependent epimerase/dehydratase family protein [Candidatus Lokiarchaeota archaeon]|nr:NAD-dependent epimerase/dehydratase family protein [Candidatus Lokiarchaeota archaeon]